MTRGTIIVAPRSTLTTDPNVLERPIAFFVEDGRAYVEILDQRELPDRKCTLKCETAEDVAYAIKTLAVRGAPLIGIAAAYGYAVAYVNGENLSLAKKVLADSRPTAKNLSWALDYVSRADDPSKAALIVYGIERGNCLEMAANALPIFEQLSRDALRPLRVMTHCNTGALATGGIGTALGAIVLAHNQMLIDQVIVNETRPLDQGARLTAFELSEHGVPFHVSIDSAAGSILWNPGVDAILVGADRIAANGDTANKIGTLTLAALARFYGTPFFVVAPTTTVDLDAKSGKEIPIEERDPLEVSTRYPAWNPAFDVTPSPLISAIITEKGIFTSPYEGAFN